MASRSKSTDVKWSLIKTLAQTYALDILEALEEKPLRYTDLEKYGPNERTRSQRLKELEDLDLVSTISMKIGRRPFVHYKLTDKGKILLEKIRDLDSKD